jgi:hypothetical protein
LGEAQYHVLLEGRKVGPYDRRTIVGMRIKEALADASVLIDAQGRQLTVEELVRGGRASQPPAFDPGRSGTYSSVKASYEAELMACDRSGPLPRFEGPLQVRVQAAVLRIAGRLKGKDDRVKIPYEDVAHLRVKDRFVELWFKSQGGKMQAATLAFVTAELAQEFAKWLPGVSPPTAEVVVASRVPVPYGIVVGVAGAVLAIVAVVLALALRR